MSADERAQMVERQLRRRGIEDERVLGGDGTRTARALRPAGAARRRRTATPRCRSATSQTISQPYMVALICEQLALRGGERVLDVGTGSGYQAAVLAELAGEVHTIERIPELAEEHARISLRPATRIASTSTSATARSACPSTRRSPRSPSPPPRSRRRPRSTSSSSRAAGSSSPSAGPRAVARGRRADARRPGRAAHRPLPLRPARGRALAWKRNGVETSH